METWSNMSTHTMTYLVSSYISGGKEVHGLRDLVGEAEEVIEAELWRVT